MENPCFNLIQYSCSYINTKARVVKCTHTGDQRKQMHSENKCIYDDFYYMIASDA